MAGLGFWPFVLIERVGYTDNGKILQNEMIIPILEVKENDLTLRRG